MSLNTNLGIASTRDARPKTTPELQNKYKNCAAKYFIEDFNFLKVLTLYIHIHAHLM
jgi:hypothetical protein